METAKIYWLLENRILYVKRPSVVNIENLERDSEQIIAMLEMGEAPIHIINDTLNVAMNPKNVRLIRKATPFLDHPNLGWFVTIASNPFIAFLGSVVPQMRLTNNRNVKVVSTTDDAITFLRKSDLSLGSPSLNEVSG